jgi:hypothetical protein
MMKTPPYDTGKVKIGEHYQQPLRYMMSRDAERLQEALLQTPQRYIDADRAQTIEVIKDSLMWTAFVLVMAGMVLTPQILQFFQGA